MTMFVLTPEEQKLRFSFSSLNTNVGLCVEKTRDFLAHSGFKHRAIDTCAIVLRELLKNAVVHGNKANSNRIVHTLISCVPGQIVVVDVADEGGGFDHELLDKKLPDNLTNLTHRGYKLINALSEKIQFVGRGNRVIVTLSAEPSAPSVLNEIDFQPRELENSTPDQRGEPSPSRLITDRGADKARPKGKADV